MFRETRHGFDHGSLDDESDKSVTRFDSYQVESRKEDEPSLTAFERQSILEKAALCLEQGLRREPDLLGGDLPLRRDVVLVLRVLSVSDYPEAAIRLLKRSLRRELDLLGGDIPLRRDISSALELLSLLTARS